MLCVLCYEDISEGEWMKRMNDKRIAYIILGNIVIDNNIYDPQKYLFDNVSIEIC